MKVEISETSEKFTKMEFTNVINILTKDIKGCRYSVLMHDPVIFSVIFKQQYNMVPVECNLSQYFSIHF